MMLSWILFLSFCGTVGVATSNQSLLLIRSCGSLLPEVQPKERTDLVHTFWEKLKEFGKHTGLTPVNNSTWPAEFHILSTWFDISIQYSLHTQMFGLHFYFVSILKYSPVSMDLGDFTSWSIPSTLDSHSTSTWFTSLVSRMFLLLPAVQTVLQIQDYCCLQPVTFHLL